MVQAKWNGAVLAESDDIAVVDGYTYFPTDAVRMEHLVPSDHHTVCGWKGQASYFDVIVDGERNQDAAFQYLDPSPAAIEAGCKDRIAFWKGVQIV